MRDAFEFGIKSFFAGCLGFLGAISMAVVAVVLLGLVFQSQIRDLQTNITGSFQSIPDKFNQGPPGEGDESPSMGDASGMEEEASNESGNAGELPGLFIYINEGAHPDNPSLTTVTKEQSANVAIWVKSSAESSEKFYVEITMPDGSKHRYQQEYNLDPAGNTVPCGKLDLADPQPGTYIIEAFPEGSSIAPGKMEFEITE